MHSHDPRIQGLRTRAVSLANGKHCIVIRIPRSWYPPHQVTPNRRFWVRHSNITIEASVDELRSLFSLSGDIMQRAHQFREHRLNTISSSVGKPLLGYRGRLILHVIPLSALASTTAIDITNADQMAEAFAPFGSGHSPRFNLDGFICQGRESDSGFTQLFRTGIIAAVLPAIIDTAYKDIPHIGSLDFEGRVVKALPRLVEGLRNLGVAPPLVVLMSLQDVRGARYAVGDNVRGNSPIDLDEIRLPDGLITAFGVATDYHRSLQPAFDALWNAAGRARDEHFTAEGIWKR